MPLIQFARGLWAKFGATENPFAAGNGMEENLRRIDDHLALYTLLPPKAPGTALPGSPADGDGQIYNDGSYATFNGGTWKIYAPRMGVRAVLATGTESWLNTGTGWAQFSVVDTGPATSIALAAKAGAELARDAALIQAGVYIDEPTGRAAVADGKAFKVQGAGDIAAYEYRRVNAGTVSTLVATYPSAGAVTALDWDTQTQQARMSRARNYSGELFNGAEFWNGSTTVGATSSSGGFRIPAGSSGTSTYLRSDFPFTDADRANLAGRPVRFYVPLKTSANFVGSGWGVAVQKDALVATSSTPYFKQIDATHWVFYWDYTPDGTETRLTAYFQKGGGVQAETLNVWSPGLFMMAQDDFGFRDAVQSNLGIILTDVDALEFWQNLSRFNEGWPKIQLDADFNGQVFNGAEFWNGSAVVGTDQLSVSGGLRIPAGQTGNQSYIAWLWDFSYEDRANFAGRPLKIVIPLKTSANALDDVAGDGPDWFLQVDATGTIGTVTNKLITKISSTSYLLTADYLASGSEGTVRMYLQKNSTGALATTLNWLAVGQFVVPMDARGFTDVMDFYTGRYGLAPVADLPIFDGYGQAFNGASVNLTSGLINIPEGSTGVNSYIVYQLPLHLERLSEGSTVELELEVECPANFYSTAPFGVNINGFLDGANETGMAVSGSLIVEQMSTTCIRIRGDYVIQGALTEYVGLYIQIGGRTATNAGYYSPVTVNYKLKNLEQNEAVIHRRLLENKVTSGDLYDYSETMTETFNGATSRDGGWGFTIPAGSSGLTTYCAFKFPVAHVAKYKGAQVRIYVLLRTSDDFTDTTGLGGDLSKYVGSILTQAARTSSFRKLDKNTFLAEFTYRFDGTETHLRPYVQVSTSGARATEGWATYAGMQLVFESVGGTHNTPGSLGYSLADMALTFRQGLYTPVSSNAFTYIKTITVKPDGTGNYTTLAAAIAAEGGGSDKNKRVLYQVYEGIYTDMDTWFPDFVDVVGIGKRDQIWFKGYMPASTPVSEIPTHQTWYWNGTGRVRNVKVTCQNMRYPIHSDSAASGLRAYQEIEDCYVEHIGNEEARAYQVANGGDPAAVWGSQHAWGCGTHSGQTIISRRTQWISRTSPFYFHTNRDFAEPTYVELDDSASVLTTQDGWAALALQPLGSGTPDRLVVKNCTIAGRLNFTPIPMLSLNPYNYRGNMNSEIEVFISGSSPVAWDSTNYTNVLELKSVDAVGSSVVVSGSAAAPLFGVSPEYQYGGSGYAARVWSAHAISCYNGFAGIDLGTRLGDCTSVNKVLNIVFDGGALSKTLMLNQNFVGQSNATIIRTLNTQLNDAAGRAFAELNPYDGIAKVYQIDRELRLKNNSAVVILKGQAVAFDGSRMLARKVTSADARAAVAGIALETIAPGRFGRVQKNGHFMVQQLKFESAPAASFGDTFGVGSIHGELMEGAAEHLLRCIEAGSKAVFEIIE